VLKDHEFKYDEREKWIITIEKKRFDVRIRNRNNSKIIIVENKSDDAADGPNQLYRYWYDGIFKPQSILPQSIQKYGKIIYLSPGNWKKPDTQTLTRPDNFEDTLPEIIPEGIMKIVFYSDEIAIWLSACMDCIDKYTEMYYCLKQYKDYWKDYHGKDY
jgi:hypothetical protein